MILVPIRTKPGLNAREHWRVAAKRKADERSTTGWALRTATKPAIPCSVRLTRVSPGNGCDDDNLAGALKSVRDEVAQWLGVDDKHRDVVRYVYAQKRGEWGVEIEFGAPVTTDEFVAAEIARSDALWHETRVSEVVAMMQRFGVTLDEVRGAMVGMRA